MHMSVTMTTQEESEKKEIEETQAQTETLTAAKDRAQLTATGAMSIVNVALLRQVIDNGEDNNSYYTASIVLIALSLSMQMIAGLLSLFVSNIKSYYTTYSGNALEDLRENICCCRVVRRRVYEKDTFGINYEPEAKDTGCTSDEKDPGCCPCVFDESGLNEGDQKVIVMYEHWLRQQTSLALMYEKARTDLDHLQRTTQAAKDQLAKLDEHKHTFTEEEFRAKAAEIQAQISEAQKQQEAYEKVILSKTISDRQGDVLKKKSDWIRKTRIYKMATFWQHIINYIFYIVFVMNMFITGLTIANTPVPEE